MGNVLNYLLISAGIFWLIFNIKSCLVYVDPYAETLKNEAHSDDVMNAILAKIFLFNVFEEDFEILVGSKKRMNHFNGIGEECNNNLTKNSNCAKVNLQINRVYANTDTIPIKAPEDMMVNCWIILYRSIIFMCVISLIRVIK